MKDDTADDTNPANAPRGPKEYDVMQRPESSLRASSIALTALTALVTALAGCSCGGVVGVDDAGARDGAAFDGIDPTVDAGDAPGIPGLVSLRVEPTLLTLTDDGVAPGETGAYRAIGTFMDGTEREVTSTAAWSIDDATLATVVAGGVTTLGRGGRGVVTARAGGIDATADLVVVLETVVIEDGLPADVATRFPSSTAADTDGAAVGLRFVYPSTGTMFPRNLERVNHQWRGDAALDLFELRFESAVAHLRFYVTARSLLIETAAWEWLAATHAGGSVEVSVRAVDDAMPGVVWTSQTVTELFSASEVLGALYYWSTGAQGVMRAHISAAVATRFYTDPTTGDTTCVSCHTVSRDGRRMAVAYGGERLREVTVPDRTLLIPATPTATGPDYGWGTFNPGATRLLYANRGLLHLLDSETGASLGDPALPATTFATHPDWAPNGTFVAVALSTRAPSNKQVTGSSLARIPVAADGSFGAPEIVVASAAADDTLYFPSVSPDSRFIAYVRGVGDSKDNITAHLMLVRSDGSAPPIELTLLNTRVRDEDGVLDTGTSMPTWAPSTTDDVFWLAMSSIRDYGDVLVGTDRDQLWGAAIDPARAEAGVDPSFAAFWMPFQQIDEGNHRAFWALSSEDECPSTVEICDGLDNDCDAIVDEMCCTPVTEVCGDGIDDDCDGTPDDGCGCAAVENCTNGIDDDCDGRIDDADEDCVF